MSSTSQDIRPRRRFLANLLHQEDLVLPIFLALLILITRVPFITDYLYNWDAANFALGIGRFDVSQHQPHPPGYPYFVWTAALLDLLLRDANLSLVLVSIALQIAAVIGIYCFATALLSPMAGLASALLLAFSPTFWTYGEIALTYSALATFSVLTAYFAYQTAYLRRDRLLACALSYAVGTGFRPDLALFVAPLLLLACYRRPSSKAILGLAVAGIGILCWIVPTALLSGGFPSYLSTLSAYFGADVFERYAPTANGIEALFVNVRDTSQYLFYALYAAAAVVLPGAGIFLWRVWRRHDWSLPGFFALWVAPMAIFYLLLHVGDPGYVFSVLPAAILAGVAGWSWVLVSARRERRIAAGVLLAFVLLCNMFIFLGYQKPLMLWGLRANDLRVAAYLSYLSSYSPSEILIVSYDSYKHFRYYLPQYTNSAWLDTKTPQRQVFPVPDGAQWVVLVDPSVFALAQTLPAEAEFLPGENWAALLAVEKGQSLVYEAGRLTIQP